jgi:hypothetical protein
MEFSFQKFADEFDYGETNVRALLKLTEMNKDIYLYVMRRNKRKSLGEADVKDEGENKNNPNNQNNRNNIYSPLKDFEEEKLKFVQLARENMRLKIEIALEKKISESIKGNENLNEKFEAVKEQINKKPDTSYIDKNIDVMLGKIKQMRRELKQLNNN